MGKFLLQKFLVGGSFFLLTASFIACKPLVRQSISDLTAISDANLTLGIVPITHSNGMHAYRMLLCKKAEAYPPSMLADESRCRTALHDRSGAEVAFFPNDFRRDFGTKYKGYAKKATILTLAIVPFAILGARAGAWRHAKKIKSVQEGNIAFGDKGFSGDFTRGLIDKGLGDSGYLYYSKAWDFQFNQSIRTAKSAENVEGVIRAVDAIADYKSTLSIATNLKALEDNKKLLAELGNLPPDQKATRLAELEEEVKALNNGVLGDAENSFIKEFNAVSTHLYNLTKKKGYIHKGKTPEGLQELRRHIEELENVGKSYRESISRNKDIVAKMEILNNRNNLEQLAKDKDKEVRMIKENLLDQDAKSLRGYVEAVKLSELAGRDSMIGAAGGAGLATAILLAIDKSIWGYDDRQVSKHWNQIFVENDDFNDIRRVKDVHFILQVLADRFGFFVSEKALQLAR